MVIATLEVFCACDPASSDLSGRRASGPYTDPYFMHKESKKEKVTPGCLAHVE